MEKKYTSKHLAEIECRALNKNIENSAKDFRETLINPSNSEDKFIEQALADFPIENDYIVYPTYTVEESEPSVYTIKKKSNERLVIW